MGIIVDIIWTLWVIGISYIAYDYLKLKTSDWKDL